MKAVAGVISSSGEVVSFGATSICPTETKHQKLQVCIDKDFFMREKNTECYVSKAPKTLQGLDNMRKRVQDRFLGLHAEERWYAAGGAFLMIAVVLYVFKRQDAGLLVRTGAVVFAVGLVSPVERLYQWLWQLLLGKLCIVGLIALVTNLAYGVGRQLVAILIGTSPEPLSATVNVATILLSPLLFFGILATFGFFVFILASYCGTLAIMTCVPPWEIRMPKSFWLWSCRFVALGIAVFGSFCVLKQSSTYLDWASCRCAYYLYTFDMYHDGQFAKGKTEKVAFLAGGRILVGVQKVGGYGFEIRPVDSHK